MSDIKYIDFAEFRDLGFLQELNRRVLHPAGLALEILIEDDGTESFGGVWDYRDDPEGCYFGTVSADKCDSVDALIDSHAAKRIEMFGSVIQPAGTAVAKP